MRFEVTILGNGSASPVIGRHHSAHVLNVREQFYLIDCGEGTQERLLKAGISPLKIRAVFISHAHGDHVFGLAPLIASMGFLGRRMSLQVFGPAGVGRLLDFFRGDFGLAVDFPLEFVHVDTASSETTFENGGNGPIFENGSVEVFSIPLRHRVPTNGYLFREKTAASRPAFGKLVAAENSGRSRSYAYLSDTLPSPKATGLVRGVDLLYHDCTFADTERSMARRTGHSTASQAAGIALKAGVSRLLLGHFSARYKDLSLLEAEAKAVFHESFIATEGATFSVPPSAN